MAHTCKYNIKLAATVLNTLQSYGDVCPKYWLILDLSCHFLPAQNIKLYFAATHL